MEIDKNVTIIKLDDDEREKLREVLDEFLENVKDSKLWHFANDICVRIL